ncbi:unnamed protein product [Timema podura]|uniref:Ribosomal protein L16 n=1 Tax=Timema podura TaxID=61482 RepID=A0ABN7PL22_TIMPD|nr:unnamed protein product [Timema podura]
MRLLLASSVKFVGEHLLRTVILFATTTEFIEKECL